MTGCRAPGLKAWGAERTAYQAVSAARQRPWGNRINDEICSLLTSSCRASVAELPGGGRPSCLRCLLSARRALGLSRAPHWKWATALLVWSVASGKHLAPSERDREPDSSVSASNMTWVLPEKYEDGVLDEKGEPLSKRCACRPRCLWQGGDGGWRSLACSRAPALAASSSGARSLRRRRRRWRRRRWGCRWRRHCHCRCCRPSAAVGCGELRGRGRVKLGQRLGSLFDRALPLLTLI